MTGPQASPAQALPALWIKVSLWVRKKGSRLFCSPRGTLIYFGKGSVLRHFWVCGGMSVCIQAET